MELDVSNDPEIERLGANATALYALEFWEKLSHAARLDGRELDPLWDHSNDNDDETTDHRDDQKDHYSPSSATGDAHHTKQIVITTSLEADIRLYKRFRSNFGYFPVANLGTFRSNTTHHDNDTDLLSHHVSVSPLGGERWTSLLLASDGMIPDFNFMTLLRANALDMFWMTEDEVCDGLMVVPRAQFVYVEVARIQEGCYGKDFRYQLQQFDVKTQSDVLHDNLNVSAMIKKKKKKQMTISIKDNNSHDHDDDDDDDHVREQRALQALDLLQSQWQLPPLSILKQTGVVKIVKLAATASSSTTMSLKVQETARGLLQYWQDLHELGRIPSLLLRLHHNEDDDDEDHMDHFKNGKRNDKHSRRLRQQQQRTVGALQRAGRALQSSQLLQWSGVNQNHHTQNRAALVANTTSLPPSNSLTSTITKTTNSLEDVTVDISNPSNHSSSSTTFAQYGMLVLPNILSSDTLLQCQRQVQQALQDLIQEQLEPRGLQVDGLQNAFDFPFVRQRPGHRVDNRYHILDNPHSPIAKLSQHLLRTLPDYLFAPVHANTTATDTSAGGPNNNNTEQANGNDDEGVKEGYKILYGGVVHSFPRKNATEPFPSPQIWHRDGPSLFPTHHHETHCFNVFIPLIDVTTENGTTEFIPGTHADAVFEELATQVIPLAQRDPHAQHEQAVRAFVKAGTVIAFDIRVLHRGLANTSEQDRPVLYFTIAKDWFLEAHMFQKQSAPETTAALAIPPVVGRSHRQLVQRLYQMITGQRPITSSQHYYHRSSHHHHHHHHHFAEERESTAYGHPHYTTRFDLLLLELFQNNHGSQCAIQNLQAILSFSLASIGDREAMAREFIYSFGEMAVQRKVRVLEAVRLGRRRPTQIADKNLPHDHELNEYISSSNGTANKVTMIAQDFTTIEQDMSDVVALYKLTATILLEESALLSKLGFTADEHGITILLALLKANAQHSILTTNCAIGVSTEQLEETFTSWWHAGEGRFAFWQPGTDDNDDNDENINALPKKLLVVFSSLGSGIARPEWGGSLSRAAKDLSSSLDILHVLDPAFSWYCQDPSCQWRGGEYYSSQLSEYVRDYESVMFLGDSMGAAAALRFSELADVVLAFTPQVDISHYDAITRLDFTAEVKEEFKNNVIDAVTKTNAVVDIHYGNKCDEDIRQVQLLPNGINVHLVPHDFDDHVLSLHLRDKGQLQGLIEDAVRSFGSH